MSAGDLDTYCVLLTSGDVDCWGSNFVGQLGNGSTSTPYSDLPVAVCAVGQPMCTASSDRLTGVVYLSDGGDGSLCAVLGSGGGVDCWGPVLPALGGTGDYTADPPVPVCAVGHATCTASSGELTGVVKVAIISTANMTSTGTSLCAVLTSGGVDCWGWNGYGELGDGLYTYVSTPVPVCAVGGSSCTVSSGELNGVSDVEDNAGSDTFCAVLISGGVDCWGNNKNDQLGHGLPYTSTADSDVPVPVCAVEHSSCTAALNELTGVISLTGNLYFGDSYCAVLTSGGVDCWGVSDHGALGDGSRMISDVPVTVCAVGYFTCTDSPNHLVGVASTATTTDDAYCAVLTSGGVDCWGWNDRGQLGDGSTTNSDIPSPVCAVGQVSCTVSTHQLAGVKSATGSVTGGSGTGDSYCAVLTSGGVDCWGTIPSASWVIPPRGASPTCRCRSPDASSSQPCLGVHHTLLWRHPVPRLFATESGEGRGQVVGDRQGAQRDGRGNCLGDHKWHPATVRAIRRGG